MNTALPADPSRDPAWGPWRKAVVDLAGRSSREGHFAVRRRIVAGVVRALGRARGRNVEELGLRILVGAPVDDPVAAAVPPLPPGLAVPDVIGAAHEVLLDTAARRAAGGHYTAPDLAVRLIGWAAQGWAVPERALTVVDPAVGGGAFLLAAARWQVARGVPVDQVLPGLRGAELDPVAVDTAEAAVLAWAVTEGHAAGPLPRPALGVGDGLELERGGADGVVPADGADLVVGNPPFLGQLNRSTARGRDKAGQVRARFGKSVGGYTDTAAVFLLAGCDLVRPGGRVMMIQPESVLAARDARGVRDGIAERGSLVGLWVAGEQIFEAEVDVCAPVIEVAPAGAPPGAGAAPPGPAADVARARGRKVDPRPAGPRPPTSSWAPLLAADRGVPDVRLADDGACLGDVALATAGFRHHFYGLAPHVREVGAGEEGSPSVALMLTTGQVDPGCIYWGRVPARIAGVQWQRPGVDMTGVDRDEPEVADWVRARLRPKVVVAPQTRVVEAAVDADGRYVPAVPLVSVEPHAPATPGADAEETLWLVLAALLAPPVTAWAFAVAAGTALHVDAIKLAARQVRSVPLPVDREAWRHAAAELRAGRPVAGLGPALTAAYGLDPDHPVTAWWRGRLPKAKSLRA